MLELRSDHFSGQYLKAFPNDVVVITWKAEWCHFCQKLKPEYNKLAQLLLKKAIVCEIDVDKNQQLVQQNNKFLYGYKVNHFPTIVIYKNGYFIKEYTEERSATKMANEVSKYI